MASELYNTIDALSREKGIDPQIVVSAVEDAIVVATRKYYKTQETLRAELDKETGKINAFAVRTVVETPEQVEDPLLQITLDDARKVNPSRWPLIVISAQNSSTPPLTTLTGSSGLALSRITWPGCRSPSWPTAIVWGISMILSSTSAA